MLVHYYYYYYNVVVVVVVVVIVSTSTYNITVTLCRDITLYVHCAADQISSPSLRPSRVCAPNAYPFAGRKSTGDPQVRIT